MNEIYVFEADEIDGSKTQWVRITRGDDEYTWMPKSIYDEQQAQAEHFTPNLS
jgi:hypothetical protein